MSSVNRVILVGRMGGDPEQHTMQNGNSIVRFSVATSEKWKDKQKNETREKTEWHRVVFFGKTADFIDKYMKKGSLVYIEGKLQTRSWEDDDGNKKYSTEVVGLVFLSLGSNRNKNGESSNSRNDESAPGEPAGDEPLFDSDEDPSGFF